jgi:hypothetical protein
MLCNLLSKLIALLNVRSGLLDLAMYFSSTQAQRNFISAYGRATVLSTHTLAYAVLWKHLDSLRVQ